jgi:hypothetical protein
LAADVPFLCLPSAMLDFSFALDCHVFLMKIDRF